MNRRDALRQTGLLAGAVALWATLPSRTWAALAAPDGWSPEDEEILTLVGDTILPGTAGSPGAGAVGIGRFIAWMTSECFGADTAQALRRALLKIHTLSREQFARPFAQLAVGERESLLSAYEKSAAAESRGKTIDGFRHIKELAILGYFTSEPGATQALRYDPIPGTYHGSIKVIDETRCWAI